MTIGLWPTLTDAGKAAKDTRILSLFDRDPDRFNAFSVRLGDMLLDFSKTAIDARTLTLLIELAAQRGVPERRDLMFSGAKINTTEDRAVLHIALRNRSGKPILGDVDLRPGEHEVAPLGHPAGGGELDEEGERPRVDRGLREVEEHVPEPHREAVEAVGIALEERQEPRALGGLARLDQGLPECVCHLSHLSSLLASVASRVTSSQRPSLSSDASATQEPPTQSTFGSLR